MTTIGDVLQGGSSIAADATVGLIDLVEHVHATIGQRPAPLGAAHDAPTRGVTRLVYQSLRGATRLLGRGVGAGLGAAGTLLHDSGPSPALENFVGVLNGVHGDYLERTANPLAIQMRLRRDGRAIEPAGLAPAEVTGKALILVHGLCLTDLQWRRAGHDHGQALALDHGYTPLYLHYNSGLHVSVNGRALAAVLEQLVSHWPVALEQLAIVGHSMGGLVARSACHYAQLAGLAWPRHLRAMAFLGAPHHGAPLERGGNRLDMLLGLSPYSAPFTRLGKLRSAGITDLRFGNLRDEDWQGADRFALSPDRRTAVPLPVGTACYAAAGVLGKRRGPLRDRLIGDGLVPLESALGHHRRPELALAIPAAHQWVGYGLGHLDLLASQELYARLSGWLA